MPCSLLQDEVVGSAYNAAYYIKHVLKLPDTKKAFVIGEPGLEHELQEFGIDYLGAHKVRSGNLST